jgi:hypothetical protein
MGGFEEDIQFICRVCRKIYDTTTGLYEHLKGFHKILVQDNQDALVCSISSFILAVFHYCDCNKFPELFVCFTYRMILLTVAPLNSLSTNLFTISGRISEPV